MLEAGLQLIHEEFFADRVRPDQMDILWSRGWRHFGTHFFRYNLGFLGFDMRDVLPLRIRLAEFSFTKSQRRVMRRNADLDVEIGPAVIDEKTEQLFHIHKTRFRENVPNSIFDFISPVDESPCETMHVRVTNAGKLIAQSFFDLGQTSASGIYGMFDPEYSRRSLGVFTMLKEIEYAIVAGMKFYYQGYCYEGESFYDYKKRFRASEVFDWNGKWNLFTPEKQRR